MLLLEFFDSTAANDIQSQQPVGHGGEFQTAVHKELRSLERDVQIVVCIQSKNECMKVYMHV